LRTARHELIQVVLFGRLVSEYGVEDCHVSSRIFWLSDSQRA